MTTLEKAKKELEKRRQQEKNMLRDMNNEIAIIKKYYEYSKLIGEQYE
jgi:hypothetical protein